MSMSIQTKTTSRGKYSCAVLLGLICERFTAPGRSWFLILIPFAALWELLRLTPFAGNCLFIPVSYGLELIGFAKQVGFLHCVFYLVCNLATFAGYSSISRLNQTRNLEFIYRWRRRYDNNSIYSGAALRQVWRTPVVFEYIMPCVHSGGLYRTDSNGPRTLHSTDVHWFCRRDLCHVPILDESNVHQRSSWYCKRLGGRLGKSR